MVQDAEWIGESNSKLAAILVRMCADLHPSSKFEEYETCAILACELLDAIEEYGISRGRTKELLLFHGLSMYARDATRGALTLLATGQFVPAKAIIRVVLEQAILAQWLRNDPEGRAAKFFNQADVEHRKWTHVVIDASLDTVNGPRTHEQEQWLAGSKKAVIREFQQVKNMFGDSHFGKQL